MQWQQPLLEVIHQNHYLSLIIILFLLLAPLKAASFNNAGEALLSETPITYSGSPAVLKVSRVSELMVEIKLSPLGSDGTIVQQLTNYYEFDIAYISAGENDLVFELGGELYMMDLSTQDYKPFEINPEFSLFVMLICI